MADIDEVVPNPLQTIYLLQENKNLISVRDKKLFYHAAQNMSKF